MRVSVTREPRAVPSVLDGPLLRRGQRTDHLWHATLLAAMPVRCSKPTRRLKFLHSRRESIVRFGFKKPLSFLERGTRTADRACVRMQCSGRRRRRRHRRRRESSEGRARKWQRPLHSNTERSSAALPSAPTGLGYLQKLRRRSDGGNTNNISNCS